MLIRAQWCHARTVNIVHRISESSLTAAQHCIYGSFFFFQIEVQVPIFIYFFLFFQPNTSKQCCCCCWNEYDYFWYVLLVPVVRFSKTKTEGEKNINWDAAAECETKWTFRCENVSDKSLVNASHLKQVGFWQERNKLCIVTSFEPACVLQAAADPGGKFKNIYLSKCSSKRRQD